MKRPVISLENGCGTGRSFELLACRILFYNSLSARPDIQEGKMANVKLKENLVLKLFLFGCLLTLVISH
jgi:hypothetical protein